MRLVLVLILMFTVSLTSKAAKLNVVTEHWPPFIVAGGNAGGIDGATDGSKISGNVTHNVKAVLDNTELAYSIALYPWARSYHLATTEPNTLIYSLYRTKQREEHFHWFCPIYKSTPIYAFKLASNDIDINTFSALKNARIAVMRGDNSLSNLLNKGFVEGVNLDISANEETNIRKLVKGRVDVVVQSKESLVYRLNAIGAGELELEAGVALGEGDTLEHCMALSLNTDKAIIEKVTQAFDYWKAGNSF